MAPSAQPAFMSPNPLFEDSPAYEPRLWDPLKQYELERQPASAAETAAVVEPSTDTNDAP